MFENAPGFGESEIDTYICFTLWALHQFHDEKNIDFIDFDDEAASKLPLEWLSSRGKENAFLEGT